MNKTTVVNLKTTNKFYVYIGRGSIYGNPFYIGKDGTRENVIDKYQVYFDKRMASDSEFKKRVNTLKGSVLGCYCKPKACHGDIIAKYLNEN